MCSARKKTICRDALFLIEAPFQPCALFSCSDLVSSPEGARAVRLHVGSAPALSRRASNTPLGLMTLGKITSPLSVWFFIYNLSVLG